MDEVANGYLDRAGEEALDALLSVASSVCGVPVAFVRLADGRRQSFTSASAASAASALMGAAPSEVAFCEYAVAAADLVQIEDAARDERFAADPLVVALPGVRFFAGTPMRDSSGAVIGTLSILDFEPRRLSPLQESVLRNLGKAISELIESRRRADERRIASEIAIELRSDLELALDAVSCTVGYYDRTLKNVIANRAYAAWFGKTRAEISGRHIRDIIGAQLYARNKPHIERVLQGEPQLFERTIVDAKGVSRSAAIEYVPDVRDGRVHGFVAMISDASKLREAERANERGTRLLRLAEEVARLGHWRVEIGKGESIWSPQVYRIHGRDPSSFQPNLMADLAACHPDDLPVVTESVRSAVGRGEPFDLEMRIVRPDGKVRRVRSRGDAEIDPESGTAQALFGVFQDITEVSDASEQILRQEHLVSASALVGSVSNELDDPLTRVAANVDFALGEIRTMDSATAHVKMRRVAQVLVDALEGTALIGSLVRAFRAVARRDGAAIPTDVNKALELCVRISTHELRRRATLVTDFRPVPLVMASEARLSRIFLNLVVHASRAFAASDPANNRVELRTFVAEDGRVVVEVSDNGVGISEEDLSRIFDPETLMHGRMTDGGLGLAISHHVLKELGGELVCSTIRGKGTTFRVLLLPVGVARAAVAGAALAAAASGAGATGNGQGGLVAQGSLIGRAGQSAHPGQAGLPGQGGSVVRGAAGGSVGAVWPVATSTAPTSARAVPTATSASTASRLVSSTDGAVDPRRGRVLAVDDEDRLLRSIGRVLAGEYDVVLVNDPCEALRRLVDEGESYDVVFCDLMMPQMTGMDLFSIVRQRRPALAERFVFITGGAPRPELEAFVRQVPNERLDKPFTTEALRAMTHRYVTGPHGGRSV